MLSLLRFSQFLIVFFVGSVTLWYCITPYLINPHPKIVQDILENTKLQDYPKSPSASPSKSPSLTVENWTKWRLYLNLSDDRREVVYGSSRKPLAVDETPLVVTMNMEWRQDYFVKVDENREVAREAPYAGNFGIYDHFIAETPRPRDDTDVVVRIVPRFLFGLPFETVEAIYGTDVSNFPIIGIFTHSPRFDRILIQAYMNIVTLSVIFLLYANNPPGKMLKKTN